MNPMNKLFPWQLKLIRDAWVATVRTPFVVSEAFWTAWTNVMFPRSKK